MAKQSRSVGDRELSVPAVDGVTCESWPIAEILLAAEAERALAASPGEPGDTHALAHTKALHVRANLPDDTHDLVPWHQGELRGR